MALNFFRKEKLYSEEEQVARWEQEGRPAPPPHAIKQRAIAHYKQAYGLNVLVETGTYLGDMVEAQRENFSEIYSVELSEKLHKKAVRRFSGSAHIHILQGDSGTVLPQVTGRLSEPALFWLDGHYSGGITALGNKECPVPEELDAILASPFPHVILIDDARLFNGTQSYPTVEDVKTRLNRQRNGYTVEVRDDIIRLTPSMQ